MELLGVDHVSVNVKDVPAAMEFYTDVMGMTMRSDRPDFGFGGAWLNAGSQQVHLVEGEPPPALGQHFSVLVADIEATIEELRGRGVQVTDAIAVGSDRQAFLNDPEGNTIELHDRGPAT
ncbi:MAG TPA: VOC family protein [Acidimicrobiales bacterium]|nr:VOC family protein [Acidimicrobiales bacterium]